MRKANHQLKLTMTTYSPALTLPDKIFASPAASILTPIVLGSAVGIGVSSTFGRPLRLFLARSPHMRSDNATN